MLTMDNLKSYNIIQNFFLKRVNMTQRPWTTDVVGIPISGSVYTCKIIKKVAERNMQQLVVSLKVTYSGTVTSNGCICYLGNTKPYSI